MKAKIIPCICSEPVNKYGDIYDGMPLHFFPKYHRYVTNVYHMSVELHKAITKQMEELGWLND